MVSASSIIEGQVNRAVKERTRPTAHFGAVDERATVQHCVLHDLPPAAELAQRGPLARG
jgi:hypothetical protein